MAATAMAEIEMTEDVATNPDELTDEQRAMVERNMPLVLDYFKRHGIRPFDDAVQSGYMGLIRAVQLFDPDRNIKFSTYANWWIFQAHKRWKHSQYAVSVPEYLFVQDRSRMDRQCSEAAERVFGGIVSMTMGGVDGDIDIPVDHDLDEIDEGEERAKTLEALREIPDRLFDVLVKRSNGRTLDDIGEELGVTRERVRQMSMTAIKMAREILGRKCGYDALREKICSKCYRALPFDSFDRNTRSLDGLKAQCLRCRRKDNERFDRIRRRRKQEAN